MFHSTDHRPGQPLLSNGLLHRSDDDEDDDHHHRRTRKPSSRGNRRGNSPLPLSTSSSQISPNVLTPNNSHDPFPSSDDDDDPSPHGLLRPNLSRRSTVTLRSRSPAASALQAQHLEAKKKYTLAAVFLAISLVTFTVQTELAAYVQHDLGWDKAYCMLYLTHGSWAFLWPLQLAFLRLQRRDQAWPQFWRRHVWLVRTTAQMVQRQDLDIVPSSARGGRGGVVGVVGQSPWGYLVRTTALVTVSLTVAGLSWYLAVSMTTPSDLTAIYNCSAFFAYAFSVLLLKERLRMDKSIAVLVAIVGVLVVAYGDGGKGSGNSSAGEEGGAEGAGDDDDGAVVAGSTRLAGNLIIGVGSVLYGLYEVLYKRYACPPDGVSAGRGVIFANTFGSLIGCFTLSVLWIPLPILHWLGWETFELPTGETAWLLFVSVVMNMIFAGSFLVLISLTSPVLSSVAALLTIFIVAIADWFWTGQPLSGASIFGGVLIIVAFGMLSWSTWREMQEDERKQAVVADLSDADNLED